VRRSVAPLLCLLALLAALGCSGGDRGGAAAGRPAPDFSLADLDGNTVRLSDLRGKTVILDFWATWCPPCVFQVPELNALWSAHKDSGKLVVIGVAVDVEGADVVAPWVEEQGVEYTVVLGDEKLASDFGVLGFPTLVMVNADGAIESLHVGLLEHEELEDLLAEQASS
jgi:peroxiredoxin